MHLHTQRTGTDNRNHNPLPCLGPASRIHGVTIAAIPVNFKRVIYSNRAAFKIDAAYRQKAKAAHPDNGGTIEAMQALNEARAKMKGAA